MTDLRGIELRVNDIVIVIQPEASTFHTREATVLGFTSRKVKIKYESRGSWEDERLMRDPKYLDALKDPRYLIIK